MSEKDQHTPRPWKSLPVPADRKSYEHALKCLNRHDVMLTLLQEWIKDNTHLMLADPGIVSRTRLLLDSLDNPKGQDAQAAKEK